MVEVQTYEVIAIPAPFSLAQQRVKFGNHCEISIPHGGEYDVQSCLL
jgi:hypothetical protein